MISLTQEQRVEIVLFYGKYENINRVRTEFAKFYEISNKPRQVPSYMMIKRVVDRLLSTCSVHVVISPGRPKAVMTAENRERIRQLVQAKNSLSIRGIAFQIDIEQTSVWKMLRNVKIHKYK